MFDKNFINLVFKSGVLKGKYITYILAGILTITIAFILLIFVDIIIFPNSNHFNYDKIEKSSSILLGFFGIIMLFFIISMAVNGREYIEQEKNKLLKKIKDVIIYKNLSDKFVNFSLNNNKGLYKELYRNDMYKLRLWLDENDNDDFGRLYIHSSIYEKLPTIIKNNFKREEGWDDFNYPFVCNEPGIKQFERVLKILNIE